MELPIILKFQFTLEDMRVSQAYHNAAQISPKKRNVRYAGAIGLGAGCLLVAWKSHSYPLLLVPVFLLIMLVVIPFTVRNKVKRAVEAQMAGHDETEWEFDDRWVSLTRKAGKAESKWDVFTKLIRTPEGFLLYQGRNSFWLPARAFGSKDRMDDFGRLAGKRIKDFKTVS